MRHSFTDAFHTLLAGWRTRRARDRAVRKALARFSALHPDWYAACFDETFVRRIGMDAVLAGPPVDVARSWTLQFRYAEERSRERDVRQLIPVVESFVTLLRGALEEAGQAPVRGRSVRLTERPCRDRALVPEACA